LERAGAVLQERDITTDPPPTAMLEAILADGRYQLTDLLNRSGEQYRALKMKEQLRRLSPAEVLALLARNGRLVKRPIVTDGARFTVGFDPERFRATWGT
jgi:arsenate reductase